MKFEIFQMIILFSWGEKSTKFKKNFIFDTKNNLNWSRPHSLKANPGKFQIIIGDKSYHRHIFKINLSKVEASDDVLLLGITTEEKLTFK